MRMRMEVLHRLELTWAPPFFLPSPSVVSISVFSASILVALSPVLVNRRWPVMPRPTSGAGCMHRYAVRPVRAHSRTSSRSNAIS